MQLKTYRAHSMADALAEVKRDLGGEAVILHTRTFKTGGVAGIGTKSVVEITASGPSDATVEESAAEAVAVAEPVRISVAEPAKAAESRPRRAVAEGNGRRPREVFVPFAPSQEKKNEDGLTPAWAPTKVAFKPVDDGARTAIEQELSSIKRLVGQVLQATRQQAADGGQRAAGLLGQGGMPEPLFECYVKLSEAGVSSELIERLVGQVRDELSPAELANAELVKSTLQRRIAGRIAVAAPISTQSAGGAADGATGNGPQVVALVGPTGVGKTTTIAKLAATLKLRHGRKVGLVTADTYRIAAIDQLRVYANIIGVPIKIAMTPGEIRRCVEECEGCDLVLVDTAGRSHNDTSRLQELSEFLAQAQALTRLLVLSASAAEPVMRKALEKFAIMGPTGMIVTKLDESVSLGPVFNVLESSKIPLAYVTTGQEVPDQIEVANADRLARAVLAGELSS